jgi:hypothetical protein
MKKCLRTNTRTFFVTASVTERKKFYKNETRNAFLHLDAIS